MASALEQLEMLRKKKAEVKSQRAVDRGQGAAAGMPDVAGRPPSPSVHLPKEREEAAATRADVKGTEFHITQVNGIADLTVAIEGPGVYVAKGPNGSGKTKTIEAMRAASGDTDATAEPSDGEGKGKVSVRSGRGEVALGVGNRNRLNGAPLVRLLSTGSIGQLIDPGLKDSALSARARIKALMNLMPMAADEAARRELSGNDEELQRWIVNDPSTDALQLGEAVRLKANELALMQEKSAMESTGEAESLEGLINEIGELDYTAGELPEAEALAQRLDREAFQAGEQAKARQELARQQSAIRGKLGERPDASKVQSAGVELGEKITALRAELQAAELAWAQKKAEYQRLIEAERNYDALTEILKRVPEGATPEEANALLIEAGNAAKKVEVARKLALALDYKAKHDAARDRALKCGERGKALRDLAAGTAGALGRLLERRGLPGLVIEEGRLLVKQPDGTSKDFETRLSFGERVRVALEVGLLGQGQDHGSAGASPYLLPLEPEFWLALDDGHKAEVNNIAKERGVILITEEPADGQLRVEKL